MKQQEKYMPLYEFECLECNSQFEKIVPIADAARDVTCPKCSSSKIKKVISAGSHRLSSGSSLSTAGAGCPANSRFR
ncbi:FmdB family zinc ribbon protein [Desulfopila aestuarii]|nr:zinc ribbon domain-containing protein [Desulfopila aestuarii]